MNSPADPTDAIRLRLLTGQRGGEVHRMAWEDVDLDAGIWSVPPEIAKSGREHRVVLTKPACAVLRRRRDARSPDQPRVFPRLYHQRKDLRALGAIHKGDYRWHDLRRTVATRLAGLGVPETTISRVLGHAQQGVTATVYNQHEYDPEKRRAMDSWARALDAIVSGRKATATLIPIGERA